MKSVSSVWPSRNFSASLSKSSNSRSRIGMTWPGTSSRTSGLLSDPLRPVVVTGSIPRKVLNPSGIPTFPTRSTGNARSGVAQAQVRPQAGPGPAPAAGHLAVARGREHRAGDGRGVAPARVEPCHDAEDAIRERARDGVEQLHQARLAAHGELLAAARGDGYDG